MLIWERVQNIIQFNILKGFRFWTNIRTILGFVLAAFNLYFNYRVLDSIYMFLIVWYYCTLTIRESILKVNGSRIKVRNVWMTFLYHLNTVKKFQNRTTISLTLQHTSTSLTIAGLVARASLHLDGVRGHRSHLAGRRVLPSIQVSEIHVSLLITR